MFKQPILNNYTYWQITCYRFQHQFDFFLFLIIMFSLFTVYNNIETCLQSESRAPQQQPSKSIEDKLAVTSRCTCGKTQLRRDYRVSS